MRNINRLNRCWSVLVSSALVATIVTTAHAGDPTPPPDVPGVCCVGAAGANCIPAGSVLHDCFENGRAYIIGATCNGPNPCVAANAGACCRGGGLCIENYEPTACENDGGLFQGAGSTCSPNPCIASTHACCFQNGTCEARTDSQCVSEGGITLLGQTCTNNPCGVGACCTTVNCVELNTYNCLLNGYTHQGGGTICEPGICGSFTQACCFNDSTCSELTLNDCTEAGGTPQGQGVTCENAECGNVSCCLPEGGCILLPAGACNFQGGILLGGPTCDPNPCGTGGCCTTTNCVNTDAYTCIFNGYSYLGAGVACTPGVCLQPCICLGDVNMDLVNNAHDIQAFVNCVTNFNLGCSCADTNVNGQVNQADIGQFISIIMNSTGECL